MSETKRWQGKMGKRYTDRNMRTSSELDDLYLRTYGVGRRRLNWQFLDNVPLDASILEVGCNVGVQLRHLREMGFRQLWGIELQQDAIDRKIIDVPIDQGAAMALPYDDNCFDLVFTSGLLIHLSLPDLVKAIDEIHRCTRRWIWGFEYYSAIHRAMGTEFEHWHEGGLWCGDFPRMFIDRHKRVRPILQRWMQSRDPGEIGNVGHMYLLEKME